MAGFLNFLDGVRGKKVAELRMSQRMTLYDKGRAWANDLDQDLDRRQIGAV